MKVGGHLTIKIEYGRSLRSFGSSQIYHKNYKIVHNVLLEDSVKKTYRDIFNMQQKWCFIFQTKLHFLKNRNSVSVLSKGAVLAIEKINWVFFLDVWELIHALWHHYYWKIMILTFKEPLRQFQNPKYSM